MASVYLFGEGSSVCVCPHKSACCFFVYLMQLPHIWLCLLCHFCWCLSGGQRAGLSRDLHWLFPRPDGNNSPRACTIPNTALECFSFLLSFFSLALPGSPLCLYTFLHTLTCSITTRSPQIFWAGICPWGVIATSRILLQMQMISTHLLCVKYVQKLNPTTLWNCGGTETDSSEGIVLTVWSDFLYGPL